MQIETEIETDPVDFDFEKEIMDLENSCNSEEGNGDFCVSCGKYSLFFNGDMDHCASCGKFSTHIDQGAEWANYADDSGAKGEDNSRCTYSNPLFSNSSVSFCAKSSGGKGTTNKTLKRLNWGTMTHDDRSLWQLTKYFDSISDTFNISKEIINKAINNYILLKKKRSTDNKKAIFRGKVREGLIAACLYNAFKETDSARSHNDIAIYMNLDTSDVTSGCKLFSQITHTIPESNFKVVVSKSEDFIRRYCSRMGIKNYKFGTDCIAICREAAKIGCVYENTPKSVAAGVVYFLICHNEGKVADKKNVSYKLGISSVTITKIYTKLKKYEDRLIKVTKN